jgi:hypothetical protein
MGAPREIVVTSLYQNDRCRGERPLLPTGDSDVYWRGEIVQKESQSATNCFCPNPRWAEVRDNSYNQPARVPSALLREIREALSGAAADVKCTPSVSRRRAHFADELPERTPVAVGGTLIRSGQKMKFVEAVIVGCDRILVCEKYPGSLVWSAMKKPSGVSAFLIDSVATSIGSSSPLEKITSAHCL